MDTHTFTFAERAATERALAFWLATMGQGARPDLYADGESALRKIRTAKEAANGDKR